MRKYTTLLAALLAPVVANAQTSPQLHCEVTLTQLSGKVLDRSVKSDFPDFFTFDIDPGVGDEVSWIYQNRCISRHEITGAKFSGNVCVLVYSQPAAVGEPPTELLIDLSHILWKSSKHRLASLAPAAATAVVPLDGRPVALQLSSQSGGLALVQLQCRNQ